MASLNEKLRVLIEWSPLIGLASEISAATTPLDRALKTSAALRWLASKTDTTIDDEFVDALEAVLETPQGKILFDHLVLLVSEISNAEVGA